MASRQKLSGMQKQVLGLYRQFLRASRLKSPEERRRIESIVSSEFRHNAKNVERKNFLYIEYLMRQGKKQLEQLKSADIVAISTVNLTSTHLKKAKIQENLTSMSLVATKAISVAIIMHLNALRVFTKFPAV